MMDNKKERLGGRYGGEPEKAIADPGNLDVKNPIEERFVIKPNQKQMTKAMQWASKKQIPRHKEYARAWIQWRTGKAPYMPSGEHISNKMKDHIRHSIDSILEENAMPKLKDIIQQISEAEEHVGADEKEPGWAKIYRLNSYDRSKEIEETLKKLQKLTGRKQLPPGKWLLDDYEMNQMITKHIPNMQAALKRIDRSLRDYQTAMGRKL